MSKSSIHMSIKVELPKDPIIKGIIRSYVEQNTNYLRNSISEGNKAIATLQKQVKAMEVKLNRLDAQKKR